MSTQQTSKKAARKARKRQKQKAKRKEKQEAMELEKEMDEWAQTTYDQLITMFLNEGISREEAWRLIQKAKQLRKKNIEEKRELAKIKHMCEVGQKIEVVCKEIQKYTEINSPEGMAKLKNQFGDKVQFVKDPDSDGVLMFF